MALHEIMVLPPIRVPGIMRKAVAVPSAMEWWERGVALADAPDRFAPAALAAPAPRALPADGGDLTGGWKKVADQAGWPEEKRLAFKNGLNAVQGVFENIGTVGVLNYKRHRHVADLILARKAIAVGFPMGAAEPQIIPAYLLETDSFIKWGKSEIVGNGLHFVSVKIAKLPRSEQLPEIPNKPTKNEPKKVGRRASSEVRGIIHELNADPSFGQLPRKSQTELVIEKTSEKYPKRFPHGKGLHKSTVSRYLHEELGG